MLFWEAVQMKLDELGMSSAELARRANVYPAYLSRLKHGYVKDPTWNYAVRIIAALGMTPTEFNDLLESDNA